MFKLLKKLLGIKSKDTETYTITREGWLADFSRPKVNRFEQIDEERYSSFCHDGFLDLELNKKNLFAWSEMPDRIYDDFIIKSEIKPGYANGKSAAGFIFRKNGDDNFTYALVSKSGHVRLDAVFNGTPHSIIAWTECILEKDQPFELTIIARGSLYTILVNDQWVCEAVDDTTSSGTIAFAGQNFGDQDKAVFSLQTLYIESRLVEIETIYHQLVTVSHINPDFRVKLAETFLAMNQPLPALVQIRKAQAVEPISADGLFLKSECAIELGLYEEAEEALKLCLESNPEHQQAKEEQANLLYLRGNFLDLRDLLLKEPDRVSASSRLSNLLGHAYFNLGYFDKAAREYHQAAELEPEMPLFHLNEARTLDRLENYEKAADSYFKALEYFFAQNDFDDLSECLDRLKELRPNDIGTQKIMAHMLYHDGKYKEAERIISGLLDTSVKDGSLCYLYGMLMSRQGKRNEAIQSFSEAVELEPDSWHYHFRLAESLFLDGKNPKEHITIAVVQAPEDGWIRNLQGQILLSDNENNTAAEVLEIARKALPTESAPVVNLSEALYRSGKIEQAIEELDMFPEDPSCLNQKGNLLSKSGKIEEAISEYGKAIRLARGFLPPQEESDILTNYASACIHMERWSDAEAALRQAYELFPGAETIRLLGDIASIYGDWIRAETAYRTALEADPKNTAALMSLSRNYLTRGLTEKADQICIKLESIDTSKGQVIRNEILDVTTEIIQCASCDRQWRIPKKIPIQNSTSIKGIPPDESPAGACPECNKIYCIKCRKDFLVNNRFTCPDCGKFLKLSDDKLKWLVRHYMSLNINIPED